MDYISVKAASEKWGISERRIQKLCEENRIDGTEKFGRAWMIPKNTEKPADRRMKVINKREDNHGI
ncbi:DNA-binding protein [Clostridium sp.]|uniref:DNA-binding protein n=1 Tax=Clostridium sp. TaxID=1506 RepID=UPI0035A0E4C7